MCIAFLCVKEHVEQVSVENIKGSKDKTGLLFYNPSVAFNLPAIRTEVKKKKKIQR